MSLTQRFKTSISSIKQTYDKLLESHLEELNQFADTGRAQNTLTEPLMTSTYPLRKVLEVFIHRICPNFDSRTASGTHFTNTACSYIRSIAVAVGKSGNQASAKEFLKFLYTHVGYNNRDTNRFSQSSPTTDALTIDIILSAADHGHHNIIDAYLNDSNLPPHRTNREFKTLLRSCFDKAFDNGHYKVISTILNSPALNDALICIDSFCAPFTLLMTE